MLREETEGRNPAWNRRAAGSRSVCRGRPSNAGRADAGRGGLHAGPVRSHRAGRLRASSLRSRPHRPAKEPAACFPRERADANGRRGAKRPRPTLNVLRSNSNAPHSRRFPVSRSLVRELALGSGTKNLPCPPVLIRVKAVYYTDFPSANMTWSQSKEGESTSSIKR